MTSLAADPDFNERTCVERMSHNFDALLGHARCVASVGKSPPDAMSLLRGCAEEGVLVGDAHARTPIRRQPSIDLFALIGTRFGTANRPEQAVHLGHGVVAKDA
jgi:hypothetical protein